VIIHTTKNYSTSDATSFHVLGRIFCGTLKSGQDVRILGENYSLKDPEDSFSCAVGRLWVFNARLVFFSFYYQRKRIIIYLDIVLNLIEFQLVIWY